MDKTHQIQNCEILQVLIHKNVVWKLDALWYRHLFHSFMYNYLCFTVFWTYLYCTETADKKSNI